MHRDSALVDGKLLQLMSQFCTLGLLDQRLGLETRSFGQSEDHFVLTDVDVLETDLFGGDLVCNVAQETFARKGNTIL